MPRIFGPDERITFSVPARYINVLMDMLRRPIPVVPYEVLHLVIVDLEQQLTALNEASQAQTELTNRANGPMRGIPPLQEPANWGQGQDRDK